MNDADSKRLEGIQKKFHVLDDWVITKSADIRMDGTPYSGECTFDVSRKTAAIAPWHLDRPEPADYLLHEVLHIAIKAASEIREKEELLVQDLCSYFDYQRRHRKRYLKLARKWLAGCRMLDYSDTERAPAGAIKSWMKSWAEEHDRAEKAEVRTKQLNDKMGIMDNALMDRVRDVKKQEQEIERLRKENKQLRELVEGADVIMRLRDEAVEEQHDRAEKAEAELSACKERVRELEGLAERMAGRKCCCITPCEPEDVCAPCQARKLMEAQEQIKEVGG